VLIHTSERNEAVLKVTLAPLRHDGGEDVEVITTWEAAVASRNPMLLFAHSPIGNKTVETDFDHLQSRNLINWYASISDANRKLDEVHLISMCPFFLHHPFVD